MKLEDLHKPQIILHEGEPAYALIPLEEYEGLVEALEDLEDIRDFKKAITSDEESVPMELVDSLLEGGNPVKIWREYRGLSQKQLAQMVGVATPYLSQIETGKRVPSLKTASKIAKALDIDLDDLDVNGG